MCDRVSQCADCRGEAGRRHAGPRIEGLELLLSDDEMERWPRCRDVGRTNEGREVLGGVGARADRSRRWSEGEGEMRDGAGRETTGSGQKTDDRERQCLGLNKRKDTSYN